MTTKLEGTLKREVVLDDQPYTIALSPQGLKITKKGARNGLELSWAALVGGDAVDAAAPEAAVDQVNL